MTDRSGCGPVRRVALIGGLVLLSAVFFARFTPAWIVVLRILAPGAVAVLLLLASFASGHLSLTFLEWSLRRWGRLEDSNVRISAWDKLLIGVPAYGTLCGILAWPGLQMALLIATVTFLLGTAGLVLLFRRLRTGFELPRLSAAQILLLTPPILLALMESVSPVTSPDELVYKLGVPHLYLQFGRMLDLPLSSNSYFTMSLSLVGLSALILSGGIAAKLVHLVVYLLALRAVMCLARRLNPGSETWAVGIVAWTPALMIIAGWCWTEWAVIGLLTLSYDRWSDFRNRRDAACLAVATLALAGAVSVKYTALPWLAAFLVVLAFQARNKRFALPMRTLVLSGVSLLLFGGFFYLRNFLWTGSPVAPFLLPDPPQIEHFGSDSHLAGWMELIRGNYIVQPALLDDSLGILLPLSVLLAPLAVKQLKEHSSLLWIGIIQLAGLLFVAPLSRLFSAALIPLSLCGATLFAFAWGTSSRVFRACLAAAVGLALAGQLLLVLFVFVVSYDIFPYLVGAEDAKQELARTRSFAAVYQWIDQNTPEDALIFVIGENRIYDLDRPCMAAGNLDGPRIAHYLEKFTTADALAREFKDRGVSYLLFRPTRVRSGEMAPPPKSAIERVYLVDLSVESFRTLHSFLASYAVPVYQDKEFSLYALFPRNREKN